MNGDYLLSIPVHQQVHTCAFDRPTLVLGLDTGLLAVTLS
jgi:hypothetical protein